jgi:folate-dependent phosphoribosylglycinamide formyltransferase PurN
MPHPARARLPTQRLGGCETSAVHDGQVVAAYPVPVEPNDTPETLRQRVHDTEPGCWIDLLGRLTTGQRLPGVKVTFQL